MTAARCDVPVGEVPDYGTFRRLVWAYRDEQGGGAVGAPPWMYAVIFDEPMEADLVVDALEAMAGADPALVGRWHVEQSPDGGTQVAFADLEILHTLLQLLACFNADRSRQVTEFMLWTLGFRWV